MSAFLLTAVDASAANLTANTSSDDCSGGTGGLQECLDVAVDNGEADTITLEAGTYSNGTYTYNAAVTAEDFPLTLVSVTPGQALIDGGNSVQGMDLISSGVGDTNTIFTIQGLAFTGGTAGNGGGLQISTVDADAVVENCEFSTNVATLGAGLDIQSSASGEIFVRSNLFSGNIADSVGGGAFLVASQGNVSITANTFDDNDANTFEGGGLSVSVEGGTLVIDGNTFSNNEAVIDGGGFFVETEGVDIEVIITNNIVFGNQAGGSGGGIGIEIEDQTTTASLTNNTLFNNTSQDDGGGIIVFLFEASSLANIYNNIIFGNTANEDGDDIYTAENDVGAIALFNNLYTDFFSECQDGGGSCVTEGGNIVGQDPLFVDSATGDFHLTADSPARDAGDPAAPEMPSTDFDGNPRPDQPGTNPDIGAFEFQVPLPTPSPSPTPTVGPNPEISGGGCSLAGISSLPVSGWWFGLSALALAAVRWRKRG
ncbi:MAG TPA: choice-of-anchor Q domain-containing protein [bacterium]|nr:choice-of-anchor Q domain-containing protein [bacterium]